jgi:hypothetical protein
MTPENSCPGTARLRFSPSRLPEAVLNRSSPHDSLTLLEHLWQVYDRDLYNLRIYRALDEDHPAFDGVDVSVWPSERRYRQQTVQAALDGLRAARTALLERLAGLDAAGFARPARLLMANRDTNVRELCEMLDDYDRDHRWRMARCWRCSVARVGKS